MTHTVKISNINHVDITQTPVRYISRLSCMGRKNLVRIAGTDTVKGTPFLYFFLDMLFLLRLPVLSSYWYQ